MVGQCETRRHPTATVMYNDCYHLFQKRTFVHYRVSSTRIGELTVTTSRLHNAKKYRLEYNNCNEK